MSDSLVDAVLGLPLLEVSLGILGSQRVTLVETEEGLHRVADEGGELGVPVS